MTPKNGQPDPIYTRPAALLQRLIRFDTTNPPGNERECIVYLNQLLTEAGFETTILYKDPNRPNLLTRLPGSGQTPPLLMYGHVDVVNTANQVWRYPPFEATIADGFIWGRGALDMKNGVAMIVAALLRAKAEGLIPPGDVILALLSDEEALSTYGAEFLVNQHPEQFAGVRYAIGEFGAFSINVAGQKFYPIMVGEKQVCSMRATIRGPGGHGSLPMRGGTMATLARMLATLDRQRLPVHITPASEAMLSAVIEHLPEPVSKAVSKLLNPRLTDRVLDLMDDGRSDLVRILDPLLHNTVNATMIRGGTQINVIPSQIVVDMDGRLLPGFTPDDMLRELGDLLGDDIALEVTHYNPGPAASDMGLFTTLADILSEADPAGVPIPYLLSAVTDSRHFARLGIQTYGYIPTPLPPDFEFAKTIHAANERVPVAALDFGTAALYEVLKRFGVA